MHYKFLDSSDLDKVLVDGTMMISSLEYFRKLEMGDIGDRLEGATEVTIRDGMTVTEGSLELERLNAANLGLGNFNHFAKVEGGGQINIVPGVRLVHLLPELYIYSFSQGDLETLADEMCVRTPKPYDACLQIKDATELGRTCLQQGTIKNQGDRRVCELFKGVWINVVEYVPRSVDITEGGAMVPDPFKKGDRFSHQSEARFVFVPRDGIHIPDQRLVVAIPDPSAHFELVFRNRARS